MLVPARTRTRGRHAPRRVCPETSECGPRAGSCTRTREPFEVLDPSQLVHRPVQVALAPVVAGDVVCGERARVARTERARLVGRVDEPQRRIEPLELWWPCPSAAAADAAIWISGVAANRRESITGDCATSRREALTSVRR